jgi:uncharacterized membrane protein
LIRSLLIGAVSGMRSLTPLAVVSDAARRGALPEDNGAPAPLGHPLVSAGTAALAVGELAGDKMKTAPDRIVAPGIAARLVTGSIVGAALAPREQQVPARPMSPSTCACVRSAVSGRRRAGWWRTQLPAPPHGGSSMAEPWRRRTSGSPRVHRRWLAEVHERSRLTCVHDAGLHIEGGA